MEPEVDEIPVYQPEFHIFVEIDCLLLQRKSNSLSQQPSFKDIT